MLYLEVEKRLTKSAIIPLTVLAAFIQACVPRAPACSAANTYEIYFDRKRFIRGKSVIKFERNHLLFQSLADN